MTKYEDNKEDIKTKRKKHYQKHKGEILRKAKERYDTQGGLAKNRAYYEKCKKNGKAKEWARNKKLKVFQKVSGQEIPTCVYCGCDDIRFLEINHINGGGGAEFKRRGCSLYIPILYHNRDVDDLEVACRPCNAVHYLRLKYGQSYFQVIWKGKSDEQCE